MRGTGAVPVLAPGGRSICVPREFEPVLERLATESAAHFGAPDVRLVPVAFADRQPSFVVRVGAWFPGEEVPRTHLFVKVFKPRPSHTLEQMRARVVRDFESTRRIHEAMAAYPDLGTVTPVACYPDHLAVITEETRGETLAAFVETRARWFPGARELGDLVAVLARTGRWVRAFQSIDPQPGEIALAALRSYIDVRLERLVREPLARLTETQRSRVLRHLDALGRLVPPADLAEVSIHADLAPGNVLVAGRRIVVLDFAMMRRGSRLHDLSRLYVQLELLNGKPQFQRHVVKALQRALLQGFDPDLTDSHPLFRLLLVLHRINHLNTLAVRREHFPATLYNAHLRRQHRRWLEREVSSTERAGATQ
jgi:Ser/Thr protein kinase RdoA (MazF antagonist)